MARAHPVLCPPLLINYNCLYLFFLCLYATVDASLLLGPFSSFLSRSLHPFPFLVFFAEAAAVVAAVVAAMAIVCCAPNRINKQNRAPYVSDEMGK